MNPNSDVPALRTLSITSLMEAAGIAHSGSVDVSENMSGLEPNPKDDWLYLALLALRDIASRKRETARSAACIGCGNGIDAIAVLRLFPRLQSLQITDILEQILPQIRRNIEANVPDRVREVSLRYLSGPDAEPLTEKVDLLYANLPLIMVQPDELSTALATTTLTDAARYESLSTGRDDALRRWSLLSQLGFLLSAREKLNPGGSIITLLGGRVPYEVLAETFARAELQFREICCAFKKQSDPQFIAEYADYEKREGAEFYFYDYGAAAALIRDRLGASVPDVVPATGDQLKALIAPSRLNAVQAYEYARNDRDVGHVAFAFEAFP